MLQLMFGTRNFHWVDCPMDDTPELVSLLRKMGRVAELLLLFWFPGNFPDGTITFRWYRGVRGSASSAYRCRLSCNPGTSGLFDRIQMGQRP